MGKPMQEPTKSLADCFREGVDARRDGGSLSDNPYPAGSAERHEWDAGFQASPDLDEDDDPASSRLSEKFD